MVCVSSMENTACDRELSAFIVVAATVRDLLPSDINSPMSWRGGKEGRRERGRERERERERERGGRERGRGEGG